MGFFKNLWNDIKDVAREVKEVVTEVKEVVTEVAEEVVEEVVIGAAKATTYVGERLQDAGKWIEETIGGIGTKHDPPTIDVGTFTKILEQYSKPYDNSDSSSINEEMKKKAREVENEMIDRYQKKVKKKARKREGDIKIAYMKIYKPYFADFKEVFDKDIMDNIESYYEEKSLLFENKLRDPVNTQVNSSYQPWKQLISSHPTAEQLQAYCDRVYSDADNNLLDLLQTAIEETNQYISRRVIEYNDDKAKALTILKESLVKLTSDEETKAQELKKIAEELAVAQYIAYEASLEI